jgi:hypothetical protein
MAQNYINIHLPQYPCIFESWLHDILKLILKEKAGDTDSVLLHGISPEPQLGDFEYFVILIILVTSSLTLTLRAETQAVAASDPFFASAISHLKLMKVNEIQTL